ncbi:MAG TPA: hypothetical protein VNX02_05595 [Steroidobacteraceae bacterium]|jgi:hypothetical protein|nr:hypothetical protein [Steroidobacteraceae bacterium]
MGALHSVLGREADTVHCVEAACREDPLAPIVHGMGSFALATTGRFADAEALARHGLELQPDHLFTLRRHAYALSGLARHAEAVATMERALPLAPTPISKGVLGLIYGRAGRHGEAGTLRAELEALAARGEISVGMARLALELGSNDPARVRAAFTMALAEGCGAYHIKVACGGFLEPYRSDPEIGRIHRHLYGW